MAPDGLCKVRNHAVLRSRYQHARCPLVHARRWRVHEMDRSGILSMAYLSYLDASRSHLLAPCGVWLSLHVGSGSVAQER